MLVIEAEIRNGNVSRITRHNVKTARGADRFDGQLWMTAETAKKLGASELYTWWGRLPSGREIQIKTQDVLDRA